MAASNGSVTTSLVGHSRPSGALQLKSSSNKPNPLPFVALKTGLCYDVRMRYHAKVVNSQSDYTDPHPEDPRRTYRIYKALSDAGLVSQKGASGNADIESELMQPIPAREATEEEVTLTHSKEHWDFIRSTAAMSNVQLLDETRDGDSVYFNNDSFFCAKLSCGGVIDTCKAVVEQKVKNAMAVVRPPGHHAEPCKPAGFCMFNNVAVASRVILKEYPEQVKKILILDWDIHHGNGTQRAFYSDPNVLYISLHRHDGGKFYPGTPFGDYDKCGEGPGEGRNVNIPWPKAGMRDGDYIYAFQRVVMPIALEFNPDLVILSSGFDAAPGDELGGCFVTPAAYGHMTHMLKSLASGKLAVVLEGGYNLDSIATSALGVVKVLIGDAPLPLTNMYAQHEAVQTVDNVIKMQAQYWRCMKIGRTIKDLPGAPAAERLHDVIRRYQAVQLFTSFSMTALPIFRDRVSRSFEDQVLCTPGFQSTKTIVVIVHDPPQFWAEPDSVTGEISLHETYMLDCCRKYVQWAYERGYGVVDINAPEHYTDQDDEGLNPQAAIQDLCIYVWDNYLELSDAKNFAFISVGDASAGVVYLLGHREVRSRMRTSITFAGKQPLHPIMPIMDEFIIDWYYKNSRVYSYDSATSAGADGGGSGFGAGGNGNSSSDRSSGKGPKKKLGNVIKTEIENINELMNGKFEEVTELLEGELEDSDSESEGEIVQVPERKRVKTQESS
ncbi:hypothetical protein BZA70DRAFT_237839 [Myxozyma melibiosi]|uniref:Histone deacetylase n=1 Tax=Myxozyma melibiosi TaxID=54550 RepID=A0ABR1F9V3_9ASCO